MLKVTTQSKERQSKISMTQGNTYKQVRVKDYNNSKNIIIILTTSSIVFVTSIFTPHQLTRISTPITWLTFTLSKSSFPSNRSSPSSKAMKGRHITQLKFKWYSSSASVAYNKGRITWLRQITYKWSLVNWPPIKQQLFIWQPVERLRALAPVPKSWIALSTG